jgi:hypothetical protein
MEQFDKYIKIQSTTGIPIYICVDHNYTLYGWTDLKENLGCPLSVILLDRHFDAAAYTSTLRQELSNGNITRSQLYDHIKKDQFLSFAADDGMLKDLILVSNKDEPKQMDENHFSEVNAIEIKVNRLTSYQGIFSIMKNDFSFTLNENDKIVLDIDFDYFTHRWEDNSLYTLHPSIFHHYLVVAPFF